VHVQDELDRARAGLRNHQGALDRQILQDRLVPAWAPAGRFQSHGHVDRGRHDTHTMYAVVIEEGRPVGAELGGEDGLRRIQGGRIEALAEQGVSTSVH
jgi:hypothetical protein